jgi:hypothetical protein
MNGDVSVGDVAAIRSIAAESAERRESVPSARSVVGELRREIGVLRDEVAALRATLGEHATAIALLTQCAQSSSELAKATGLAMARLAAGRNDAEGVRT